MMVLEDNDKLIRWRIPCYCYDQRHDWSFEVEFDKELNDIVMYAYGYGYTRSSYFHYNWFIDTWRDFSNRIKIVLQVLFFGYAEYSMDLGFTGKEEIRGHIDILEAALQKLDESNREYGTLEQQKLDEN